MSEAAPLLFQAIAALSPRRTGTPARRAIRSCLHSQVVGALLMLAQVESGALAFIAYAQSHQRVGHPEQEQDCRRRRTRRWPPPRRSGFRNWSGLPKNKPSAPAALTATLAKSPVASAPQMPPNRVYADHVERVVVAKNASSFAPRKSTHSRDQPDHHRRHRGRHSPKPA